MSDFKFSVGEVVCDKDVFDLRVIVMRITDIDTGVNMYVIRNIHGNPELISSKAFENNFQSYDKKSTTS